MQTVDLHNAVFLDDLLDTERLTERVLWTDEIVQIFPKQNQTDEIMQWLQNIRHATCWRKDEIPERFHYRASPRIAPIVCSTEAGWQMTSHKRYEDKLKSADINQRRGGHGYDNRLESMRAMFIAHGSAFKKGYVAEPFANIEVYNLMCKILGLVPAKNDGDLNRVKNLLR